MADGLPLGLEAARLLARLGDADARPAVHLTAGEGRAEGLARLLAAMAPGLGAEAFPPWDCLPYDWASPSPAAMGRRMALLRRLGEGGTGGGGAPRVVVAAPAALLQRVPPPGAPRAFAVRRGEPLDEAALGRFLRAAGYRLDERVDEPGEAAVRGQVVEVFAADRALPWRIEVQDGRVGSIRAFDPATQRSTSEADAIVIDAASELPGPGNEPADEPGDEPEGGSRGASGEEGEDGEAPARGGEHWLPDAYPRLATLLDHLPGARLLASPDALRAADAALHQIAEAHRDRVRQLLDAGDARRALPPDRLYLGPDEWQGFLAAQAPAVLEDGGWEPLPPLAEAPRPRAALAALVREQAAAGRRVALAAASERDAGRLARAAGGEAASRAGTWADVAASPPGAVRTLLAPLRRGFVDAAGGVAVVAARDALGRRAEADDPRDASGPAAPAGPWPADAAELHEGDVVIHEEHGAALLDGLDAMEVEGAAQDAIRLRFAGDEALLVPAADAGRLWRYGAAEGAVALDRLGSGAWERRRAKVAEGLAATARALAAAAAARRARRAPRLQPPGGPYERVARRFAFEETPDQAAAIRAVLGDVAGEVPMDRLVVGDVGFGKTEVAIRAAAAAALSGRQVAVVAPTTVLARQHARTFERRFEGLGVAIAHLSRLVPPPEARRAREGLADGRVRIAVGTHALLARGVSFADLGLVVVDEEQRFGAAHKARLRELGQGAHVLTMTATPIPRTLQAALVGLQDLSVLLTPPARRRPVRTLIVEDDAATLAQALGRERRRGGQSFVVVPRVEDVAPTAERLRAVRPRLDLRVAHGQMPAREVDEALVGFADGRGDVLLATSIIESGLDVPRANTMVVLRPDLFGLAQLHQLRGRVGRGPAQAYCYLATRAGEAVEEGALRRLGTLQALDRLGAGMAISAADLEQRGAGELFGDQQSGHVRLIGLELYQDLLAAAIRRERGEADPPPPPELQMEGAGAVPADYLPEPEGRINLHHRLARANEAADVDRLEEEIGDRYGPPPAPVRMLLARARIRAAGRAAGVARISAGPQAVALTFRDPAAAAERHADAVARAGGELGWDGGRLVLRRPSEDADARAALALELLEELA